MKGKLKQWSVLSYSFTSLSVASIARDHYAIYNAAAKAKTVSCVRPHEINVIHQTDAQAAAVVTILNQAVKIGAFVWLELTRRGQRRFGRSEIVARALDHLDVKAGNMAYLELRRTKIFKKEAA